MAYDGELVKMENGRWARYQQCTIRNAGHPDGDEMCFLVPVELGEHYQDLLDAAEPSLQAYRARGVEVHIELDPSAPGKIRLSFGPPAKAH
ncbi:MAG: hypothetical protein HYZ28_04975 [Myxococcales bacterium]|nr:hypothetical protein [Myxococcales bacterium]